MFSDRGSLFKFSFLVVFIGLSTGFLFNYSSGNSEGGFVSPVVFGKGVSPKAKNSSPFSALFDKLGPKPKQTPISPASTLSYKGTGAILGEKTTSGSTQGTGSSSQSGSNSSSGNTSSSNSSNTSSITSTTSTSTSSSSSTSTSQTATDNSTTVLTSTQQAVEDKTNVVIGYLKSGSYSVLYGLMSSDFQNTFSLEDFVSSFSSSIAVNSGTAISAPKIYGVNNEWAEQQIRLGLIDGTTQNYLNIYHLEKSGPNNVWALFATQDQ